MCEESQQMSVLYAQYIHIHADTIESRVKIVEKAEKNRRKSFALLSHRVRKTKN